MTKKRKIVTIALLVVLGLIVIGLLGAWALFRKELQVISTIETLNDEHLYTMTYEGDYGLDALLESGGVRSSNELAVFISQRLSKGFYTYELADTTYGCSSLSAQNAAGEQLFGRNFDWLACTAMVVSTIPENGYRSICTVNLDFLGYDADYQPDGVFNSFLALAAPLVPLDGMNEKGLCVADLVVSGLPPTQQTGAAVNLTTTLAIRLLLDRAATVDEAVALLAQYNMHSDIGSMHHIAIADAQGNAVVVEYLDNTMHVTPTPMVTNFILAPGDYYGVGSEESHVRYDMLQQSYQEKQGTLENEDVKAALTQVAQRSGDFDEEWITAWSIVYNQSTLELTFYHNENYDAGYTFAVPRSD